MVFQGAHTLHPIIMKLWWVFERNYVDLSDKTILLTSCCGHASEGFCRQNCHRNDQKVACSDFPLWT